MAIQSQNDLLKEVLRNRIKTAILNMELHAIGGEEYGFFYGEKVAYEYVLELLDNPGMVICHLKNGED